MKTLRESILDSDFDIEMPQLSDPKFKQIFNILDSHRWRLDNLGLHCCDREVWGELRNLIYKCKKSLTYGNRNPVVVFIVDDNIIPYIRLVHQDNHKFKFDHIRIDDCVSGPVIEYLPDNDWDGNVRGTIKFYVPQELFDLFAWFYKTQTQK